MKSIIVPILLIINLFGFILVAIDKYKAKNKLWRIPERTFFMISILGCSAGVFLGLIFFRHKTRHWYFMTIIPMIIVVQLIAVYVFINK